MTDKNLAQYRTVWRSICKKVEEEEKKEEKNRVWSG